MQSKTFLRARGLTRLLPPVLLAACGGGGNGGGGNNNPPPPPPPVVTADAGGDQTAAESGTVQLQGTGSDSSGAAVSFAWTQVSGPTITLSSTTIANPTFVAPDVNVDRPRDIILRLTVSNDQGEQDQDDVTVTVRASDFLLFTAVKDRDNTRELYKYDVALDDAVKLSGPLVADGNVTEYKMSPDGRFAAYIADQGIDEQFELYVTVIDGSGWQVVSNIAVADGDVSTFDWAPDGSALLYIADADTNDIDEAYVVNRDGSAHLKINTPFSAAGERVIDASWSPDGRYIAYSNINSAEASVLGIDVHDTLAAGAADVRVTGTLGVIAGLDVVEWAPDSGLLAYAAFEQGLPSQRLHIVAPDGTGSTVLVEKVSGYTWSPDSNFLAFKADPDDDLLFDLFTIRPDGSSLTQLNAALAGGGRIDSYAWAPDSSRIAYTGRDSNTVPYRLYSVLPDGSASTRVSFNDSATSRTDGFGWAPDSSRIAFRENPELNTAFEIFTAFPDGTGSVRVSESPPIAGRITEFGSGDQLWAANSAKLAWKSEIGDTNGAGVYTANADGSISNLASLAPANQLQSFGRWSADSTVLAYTSQQDSLVVTELFIGAADSSMNQKVSGILIPNATVFDDFIWSL